MDIGMTRKRISVSKRCTLYKLLLGKMRRLQLQGDVNQRSDRVRVQTSTHIKYHTIIHTAILVRSAIPRCRRLRKLQCPPGGADP